MKYKNKHNGLLCRDEVEHKNKGRLILAHRGDNFLLPSISSRTELRKAALIEAILCQRRLLIPEHRTEFALNSTITNSDVSIKNFKEMGKAPISK